MGASSSKPSYSSFDDLVGDHSDVWLKFKEFLGFKSPCILPLTNSLELPEIPLKSPGSDSLSVVVHCEGVAEEPLENAETPTSSSAAAAAAIPSDSRPAGAGTACASTCNALGTTAVAALDDTPAAATTAATVVQPLPVPRLQLPVTAAEVPELPELTQRSVRDAVAAARAEVESLFTCFDQEQQQQEKEAAMRELSAAAATSSSSDNCLSAEERDALMAKGRQAQAAAKSELLTRAAASDAALRDMTPQLRGQWFQENAQQLESDAKDVSFEDDWASLPPEVMAMVAELQKKQ